MLGPIIRAEVGDAVKIVFRNMASHNHTMHPHGFRYAKNSEGLSDAMQRFDGNAVPPGGLGLIHGKPQVRRLSFIRGAD